VKGMSQLVGSASQPSNGEELYCFIRRPETVKFLENGWQERDDGRPSRRVLRGRGGEIPPRYSTLNYWFNSKTHNIC
jgi:hypothetical protein